MNDSLNGKTLLITGAARRVGKIFALACARAGTDVVIHYGHLDAEAEEVRGQIIRLGRRTWVFKADLSDSSPAENLIPLVNQATPVHGLVNSAAIFGSLALETTAPEDWQKHIAINLTAPKIIVNGLALGAILPLSDGKVKADIIKYVPAGR